ncbi:Efflux pump periplasmic linker BepF [Thalassocella blandensis]|nr:Efflux pump periplasmic linker BepF [Thalassocella blandensis]
MTHTDSNYQNSTRSHRTKAVLYSLAVIGGVTLVIVSMGMLKPKPEAKVVEEEALAKVETMLVAPQIKKVNVTSQGSVTALHKINLVAEVSGRVTSVADGYADGGFFKKDTPIVTIDKQDYEFAVRRAEAEVMKAEEVYALEKGRARQAKREWRDIGNQEANDLFLRKPQLASAKSSLDAAKANRDMALLNLERTQIFVPFNGRISKKHVDAGQYVTAGTVIAEVYSTEAVQVRLPLTDHQVASVDLPLTAQYDKAHYPDVILSTVYGGKHYQWTGKIVRTEGSLDVKSRVIYAVAEVKDPYLTENTARPPLAVGMYVSAEIAGKELADVVSLPREVLRKKNQVTLVDADNALQFRQVDVLQNNGSEILVRGLDAGERVLVTRLPFMNAGMKVDIESSKPSQGSREGETQISEAKDKTQNMPLASKEG